MILSESTNLTFLDFCDALKFKGIYFDSLGMLSRMRARQYISLDKQAI